MPHITSPAQIKEIMKENDLIFHKGLGQNFLFDSHYLESIADSGKVTKEDTVIEVGPGLGVLTTRLAERAKKVIAVECYPFVPQIRFVDELRNIIGYFITIRIRYVNTAKRKHIEYELED